MSSPASMSNAVDGDAVATEVVSGAWESTANGYILSTEARVAPRSSRHTLPPELTLRFCLQKIYPDADAVDHFHYIIDSNYHAILDGAAWDDQTLRMLTHVAADHVRTVDLAYLVSAFRRFTRSVNDRFPIMQLSRMEFVTVIEIPPEEAAALSDVSDGPPVLYPFVPLDEEQEYDFFEGDDMDVDPVRGPTPATAAAVVEGLQVKIVEEPGVCSICLEDFNVMTTRVLEMPCRHVFHNECLREWLTRRNTCPLCRFALPLNAGRAS